jgi:CAAX protease family protein
VSPPWGARLALITFAASWLAGWLPLLALRAIGLGVHFPWNSLYVELALVASVLALRRHVGPRWRAADLGLRPARPRSAAGWTVLAFLGANALVVVYAIAANPPGDPNPFADRGGTITVVAMAIAAIIAAPVAEESLYRGVLYGGLRRSWGVLPAAIVGAAVFGLVHWSFGLGHDSLAEVPMLASFGLALCLLYERTASLYPGMAMHAFTNAWIFAATGYVAVALPFLVALLAIIVCLIAPALRRSA